MVSGNQISHSTVSSANIDLDQHFGDVHAQIVGMSVTFMGLFCAECTLDKEIEIIQDLQHQVLQCAESIVIICERSAELDWYASIIGTMEILFT